MSANTKPRSSPKPISEARRILGPGGNRVRVSEEAKRRNEGLKKPQKQKQRPKKQAQDVPAPAIANNASADNSSSSDSSEKAKDSVKVVKHSNGLKPAKVVPEGGKKDKTALSTKKSRPFKRCDWITPFSDPLYTSFHDEEWGVAVHDDKKLFELLVFSQALAEMTWPAILNKRHTFRKLFEDFDISAIAQFSDKKLMSLKVNGSLLLSEQKLRAIVENAKLMPKIQEEFDSFSNYCWRFFNYKPIKNGFRYARQVPAKSPKAELISKDLMQRGFRCVGSTVIYSFMQVTGMVNDHLITCFRYEECSTAVKKDLNLRTQEEAEVQINSQDLT